MNKRVRTTPRALALGLCLAAALMPLPTMRPSHAFAAAGTSRVEITITGEGVTPAQASAAAGLVQLAVENRFAGGAVTLRVSRSDGATVREVEVPAGSPGWVTECELAPGGYAVAVVNHPSWACLLTVQ